MRRFNKMAVEVVTLILFIVLAAENAALQGCPKSEIACVCGGRPNDEVKFFEILPESFNNESKDCHQLTSEVCASHSCLPGPIDAPDREVDVDMHASRGNLYFQHRSPIPLLDDVAGESHPMLRDRRSAYKCSPPQVEHATMECYLWGEFTSCDINCSRGYAFEENGKMVLKTKRVCRESKAVWSPKNTFPLCKPFINCQAILVRPGKLVCHPGPEIPYCDISCKTDYENGYGEVLMQRYECVDKHFEESLPHCATIDNKVDMMKLSENHQTTVPKTG